MKVQAVETRGTFLNASSEDRHNRRWRSPTVITLTSLKVKEGDWLGLRASGTFSYGVGLPTSNRMAAAFLDAANNQIAPGPGSKIIPSDIPETNWPDGAPIQKLHCFGVPPSPEPSAIVRVPVGAKKLALTSPDSYWSDNSGSNYKVTITRPNRKSSRGVLRGAVGGFCENQYFQQMLVDFASGVDPALPNVSARSLSFASSPIKGEGTTPFEPQWRGWYSRWAPAASGYGRH